MKAIANIGKDHRYDEAITIILEFAQGNHNVKGRVSISATNTMLLLRRLTCSPELLAREPGSGYDCGLERGSTMNDSIETREAVVWLDDNGIIRLQLKPGAEVVIEDIKKTAAAVESVAKGINRPLLVDIRKQKSLTHESRKYLKAGEPLKIITALAFLIGSPVSRVIGNFFIGFGRLNRPVKLFDSQEKAIEWLKGHME
jgi:hypothetical protein